MGKRPVALCYTNMGWNAATLLAKEDQVAGLGRPEDWGTHTVLRTRRIRQYLPKLPEDRRRKGGAVHRLARLPCHVRVVVGHAQPALRFAEHPAPRTGRAVGIDPSG